MLQDLARGAPLDRAADADVVAAGDDVVERGAVLLQKSLECPGRLSLGVVRRFGRRAFDFLIAVGLGVGNVRQIDDQPPRRAVDDRMAAEDLRELLLQRGVRGVVHPGRDLLEKQRQAIDQAVAQFRAGTGVGAR